ncbi:hypothetical protein FSW04_11850 [Baekduia soli]|uniref:Bacterial Pleckstrin homology domain-containing protein n=1 Tax=Baekduia soli TaxID=496014 RepID=A0A5B8U586_9ACTN|nr:hypothetical protein [Baekduia soli]QEC48190.1 hypothetical protein FSW04_11850 [Baekduia soli]
MSDIEVTGGDVVVRFNGRQAVMALARQVSVPLTSVRSVDVVADGWDLDLGLRVGGTGIPHRLAFGRFRPRGGGRTFAALYAGSPALVIDTEGGDWDRLAITLDDPDAAAAKIRRAAGLA